MNATFVQVDDVELARFQRDPSLVETLFQGETVVPDVFLKLSKTMEDRVRAAGPQTLAQSLAAMDPRLKERLAERLGKNPDEWAASLASDDVLKLMEERRARFSEAKKVARKERPTLSLDKAWHGVHYLLCGEAEPGDSLLSQPVLGGTVIGDDDQGFSGYGPARYFRVAQVAELAAALNRPGLESECSARFDAKRMSDLKIYPGWRDSDADWVLDAFRGLRGFYAKVAAEGHAIVTCIV